MRLTDLSLPRLGFERTVVGIPDGKTGVLATGPHTISGLADQSAVGVCFGQDRMMGRYLRRIQTRRDLMRGASYKEIFNPDQTVVG